MPGLIRVRSTLFQVMMFCGWAVTALSQTGVNVRVGPDRITAPIQEADVVTLAGNVHSLARGEFDVGMVSAETPLDRMVLELEPSAAQQAELDSLLEAQHDPGSPLFHQWLTPAEYGSRFGASAGDLARITAWLAGHGFVVDEIAASGRLVLFSGNAGMVADTFHTEIHRYVVNGVKHIGNAQDPQIPAALAGVVGGVVSLHDFRRTSQIKARAEISSRVGARPQYSSGSTHYLFPADWATIYDLNSLYTAGTKGTGTSIAIVGRSNINLSDVTQFRSASGLTANNPTVILVGANPGLVSGDQDESTLDVEWSGAVAPAATVKFVVGASTQTTDGIDLSAQYVVNNATAPVVSTSYGSCERDMGSTELAFYNALWEQAASQGMSAFVSSGDSGASGCDSGSSSTGTGKGVNGLCSSPYSTCVGGTEFNEGSNPAQYWNATNTTSYESALSYIPEEVWNESGSNGGSGLWSSGGGASVVYPEPAWQKTVSGASAADGMRAVPDVAMAAAGHDGYIIYEDGSFWVISGTSAASPTFAGVMALVVQAKGGAGQGNANAGLYPLVNAAHNPFHATPSGNNSVPGVVGFTASGGTYNLATGLGSVDGALLVNAWGGGTSTGLDFTLTPSATTGTVQAGKTATFTLSMTESGAGKNAVALTAKAPTGVTVGFSPTLITPGAPATVLITVAANASAGAQTITLTGTDGSGTQNVTYSLTVTLPPTITLTAAASSVAAAQGSSGALSLTAATGGSFSGNITFSVTGLPTGVTAAWSANPITTASGASSNKETLTLTAAAGAMVANTSIVATAAGDGLVSSQTFTLQVQQAPGVTLAVSAASVQVQSLSTATLTVTATPQGGVTFGTNGALSRNVGGLRGVVAFVNNPAAIGSWSASSSGASISVASGLPKGFTATFGSPSVTRTGSIAWTLTLVGSASAVAGSTTLDLTARLTAANTAAAYTVSASVPMTVTLTPPAQPPGVQLMLGESTLSMVHTSAGEITLTVKGLGGVTPVGSFTLIGLPAGITSSMSNVNTTMSGSVSLTLTFQGSATARAASSTVTITATCSSGGKLYSSAQPLTLVLK
jgi:pseudomonalisin